jgi:signal peptidase I
MKSLKPLLVLALTACAAPLQQGNLPATQAPPESTSPVQSRHGVSWMGKGLNQRDLLYVSNSNGTVNVYRYWQHTLAGVLTRFTQPQGQCSDFSGNVYITDSAADSVAEYAHGATKPLRTIDESPASPRDCAISSNNGDLAVANFDSGYYTPGSIDVYRNGKGKPIVYYELNDDHFLFCTYDDRGDLLVLSENIYYYYSYYTYDFYYLPKNGTQMIAMSIPGPSYSSQWYSIEGLGWDGKYWTILSDNALYQFTIDVKAEQVGKVALTTSSDIRGPVSFYRLTPRSVATQVVGPELDSVNYWHYPAGGSSIGDVTKDLDQPVATAISLRPGS